MNNGADLLPVAVPAAGIDFKLLPRVYACRLMRVAGRIALFVLLTATVTGAIKTGPDIGEPIPAFEVRDVDGNLRNFENLKGLTGLVLLFVRSADW